MALLALRTAMVRLQIALFLQARSPSENIFRIPLKYCLPTLQEAGKVPHADHITQVMSDYDAWNLAGSNALLQLVPHGRLLSHV
jgi:hypothetical protein